MDINTSIQSIVGRAITQLFRVLKKKMEDQFLLNAIINSMKNKCTICGSYAINYHLYDRNNAYDLDLCDVHYWMKRAKAVRSQLPKPKGLGL